MNTAPRPDLATPPVPQPQQPRSLGEAGAAIGAFVQRAVRFATARAGVFALIDAVLAASAAAVVGAWVSGLTLRGDVVKQLLAPAAVIAGLGWPAFIGIRRWRQWNPALRAGRAIARFAASLGRDPGESAAASRGDRLLRHELLGALELADTDRTEGSLRSPELAANYVSDVARRLAAPRIDPARCFPSPPALPRWIVAGLVAGAATASLFLAVPAGGLTLMLSGTDGRPPSPPEPVWSTLTIALEYPAHTRRPDRIVPNPTGALRVVAGTRVGLTLEARRPASAARIVVNYDGGDFDDQPPPVLVELTAAPVQSQAPDAAPEDGIQWTGDFVARSSGTWTIVLLDDEEDGIDESSRRSAAMPLQLEPDRPPEIELLPLPPDEREVSERDDADIRFVARDDFGLVSAELVYQLPDGTAHRVSAGAPDAAPRTWRARHTWELSTIPIAERSEVLYWVEVRDNDPGLGLVPIEDGPGKVTRSATMRLTIKDDEAEHAANIVSLAKIRDLAVDLLAARMITAVFEPASDEAADRSLTARMRGARELLSGGSTLLVQLAAAIDAASMDTLTQERDVGVLAGVHGRLMALHRAELKLHEGLPSGIARVRPPAAEAGLAKLRPHNTEEVTQLEDEVIRLDDLVDGLVIERLEALVARLEASQRKLVELLEQLKAGDESVRPQIDQLEQRRRDDLRRIAEARAMLREEVDEEFMNLDAFAILQEMQDREQLSEMLRRGELDEALEQAKGQLGDVQQLRDAVQQRAGEGSPEAPELTEEERKRMELLRELSRVQDEEGNIRAQTKALEKEWRSAVEGRDAKPADATSAAEQAAAIREAIEEVNDARLGRAGRRGLEDAKEALEKLEAAATAEDGAKALELSDAARKAAEGLQRAAAGSEAKEREGKALRRAAGRASKLSDSMDSSLPTPGDVLAPDAAERFEELQRRQSGLQGRAAKLLDGDAASELPKEGRKAVRDAAGHMEDSADELGGQNPQDARSQQSSAWDAVQRAIDSLRQGSPPPPKASSSGTASTETDRDRTLRDALMEAMRDGAPEGYDSPIKRYYEELLR